MKFRLVVTILTIAIVGLFALVVKKSYDLKASQLQLQTKNTVLVKQKGTIDSLLGVTERQLEELESATDSIYFYAARNTNTFKSYRGYVANYGKKGEYYHKALTNLNAYFPNKGYVQIQESNGSKYYTPYKETKGFPEEPIMILGEPSVTQTNLIVLDQTMSVRKGVIGNPDFSSTGRNGDAVREGQVVKLLEIIESGDAKWGHIAYGNQ